MRLYIFGFFALTSAIVVGQGKLEFEKSTHDFGTIKEVDGAAEFSFVVFNSGDQPLQISQVKASCGCTTPFWTREDILPGDSGLITARYNPSNRPGAFNKSLLVTSNASNSSASLFITGHVDPRPRTIKDNLPAKYGAMRVKHRSFNMEKITTEGAVTKEFDVYNDSDSAFSFLLEDMELPEYISFAFEPMELQPEEKGVIKITYDPLKKNDLGYQSDAVLLKTSEPREGEKAMSVVVTIEEYFPPMSEEELERAPKLTLSKKSHDFGKVAKDELVETEFILVNAGKSELNIRGIKANCDCTISSLEKDTLQPDEKVKMIVTFNTKDRKGKQFKNVTIFSNDPVTPTQMIEIRAEIGG